MSAETRFSWAAGGNTGRDRMEHLKVHSFMQQSGLSGVVWVSGCLGVWPVCGIQNRRDARSFGLFLPASDSTIWIGLPGAMLVSAVCQAGTGQARASANFDVRWRE